VPRNSTSHESLVNSLLADKKEQVLKCICNAGCRQMIKFYKLKRMFWSGCMRDNTAKANGTT